VIGSRPGLEERYDADEYLVLDDDVRIVRVGPSLEARFGPFTGHVLWERLPGAQELYGPCFDEARRTGRSTELAVFYGAQLERLRATPGFEGLTVRVTSIRDLDVRTVETLAASLRAMESELAARASGPPGSPALSSPRALP